MKKYPGIPDLLEQSMQEQGADERDVPLQELRDWFGLMRYQGNTVSGFLRQPEFCPFRQFPDSVTNIPREECKNPSGPKKCRYLLEHRICHALRLKPGEQGESVRDAVS
jgi:hypothetical protein